MLLKSIAFDRAPPSALCSVEDILLSSTTTIFYIRKSLGTEKIAVNKIETKLLYYVHVKMQEEKWAIIEQCPMYEVSNYGNIRHKINLKLRKFRILKGYNCININNKSTKYTLLVHRLVAQHFIPNPENKPTVNHKDKNRINNHISNLEWATYSEQEIHKQQTMKPIEFGLGHSRKELLQYDAKTMKLVNTFPSITLASKWLFDNKIAKYKEFNYNTMCSLRTRITDQIHGRRKTVYGSIWAFNELVIDNEKWKSIQPEHILGKNGYMASTKGRIRSPKGKILNQSVNDYYYVTIGHTSIIAHRIIALTFIDNPDNKPFVNHKDLNKLNNCIENLEWVTPSENSLHYYANK